MSGSPFQNARTKLVRAAQFIEEVRAAERAYFANAPLSAYGLDIGDGLRVTLSWKGIGLIPGAVVGDCIHNLRTALDLMASELARLNGQSDKDVYFPFAKSADLLPHAIKKRGFHRCGQDAIDLVQTFSPYKGGNELLSAVNDLDIKDKHTALIVTQMDVEYEIQGEVHVLPNANTQLPLKLTKGEFAFPQDGPLAQRPLIETLKDLMELIDGILEAFARLVELRAASGGRP